MIMDDLNQSRFSVTLHVATAIAMGWLSFSIQAMFTKWVSVILAFIVLGVLGFATQNVAKGKDMKWWLGNGAFIYFMVWIVSWVFFYNMSLA